MGFAFWVHLIGICGGLQDTRVLASVSWLDPNMHLDYWSKDCGPPCKNKITPAGWLPRSGLAVGPQRLDRQRRLDVG